MSDTENSAFEDASASIGAKQDYDKQDYDEVPTPREVAIPIEVAPIRTKPSYIEEPSSKGLTKIEEDNSREKSVTNVLYETKAGADGKDEVRKGDDEEDEVEEQKESAQPLLEEGSITIDITPGYEGQDTPTLQITDKKKKSKLDIEAGGNEQKRTEKLPRYLFPFTRIKNAWSNSTNVFAFVGTATCIIFQTVGWFTCVGGVPFLSLVMLIIGSIYVYDCNAEPNIPVYLIVSGVIGTIQHVITIWTKYVPKETQGRLKVQRSYCKSLNGLLHLFLIIWFILGCVWIYGVHEVEFRDRHKDEYCHKTLYYFAFWIMNLSFILLAIVIVLSICFLVCIVAIPKE